MGSEMSPRGQRRNQPNSELKYRTSNDRLTDFDVDDELESDIRYTSTPLKRISVSRLRHQSSAPHFDSEESTDAVKGKSRPPKRRKGSRSHGRERIPGAEIIQSADHREKRRRRSKRNNLEKDEENGAPERLGKKNNPHKHAEEAAELPIAELLRKAQVNQKSPRTRYEEPIPLPELTTDTLYVQGRNGFSAVKIGNLRNAKSCGEELSKPVHVAIKVHNLSTTIVFFCQGLLGGIALSEVILATKIYTDANILAQMNATSYPHLMSGIFLFLVTICLLGAMDRMDFPHLDLEHLREVFSHRCTMVVTFPLYLVAICFHLGGMRNDENLTNTDQGPRGSQGSDMAGDEEYAAQRQIHTWKFVPCIVAWLCVALGPSDDMTATHLEDMQKYAT